MLDGRKLVRKGRIVLNDISPSCVTLLQEEDMGLLHAEQEEDKRLLHAGQKEDMGMLHAGQEEDIGLPVLHAGQEEDKLAIKYVKNTLLSFCGSHNGEQY